MKQFLFSLFFASFFIHQLHAQPCPNLCSGNGRCASPGRQCQCFEGFTGADCSLRTCPFGNAWADQAIGIDNAHNLAECSNMGLCDRVSGVCTCNPGFEGDACERKSCIGHCNNVGECQSMYYYAQTKDPGSGTIFKYDKIWDANKMYGCNCDKGYFGPDCTLRACPNGDDPMTGNGANTKTNPTQYNEIQQVTCRAGAGSFTLTFRGATTVAIPFNAKSPAIQAALEALPTLGAGSTKIVMFGSQACLDAGSTWTVEFLQTFGPLPLLVPDKTRLSFSGALAVASIVTSYLIRGTKENAACSNRGLCNSGTGICQCSSNFDSSNGYNAPGIRGDCGYATATIQYCPGQISCNAHGQCMGNPTYTCLCSDGWSGADCSERLCPTDVAWFGFPESSNVAHISSSVECSAIGTCDRTLGTCVCPQGFTGSSCNRLNCPGTTSLCSDHGQCLDLNTLASLSTVNGDNAGYSYGNTPNNPNTWDAFKIYGCLCDPGFEGYDCSLRSCPTGDDPNTENQVDEQQKFSCTDADLRGSLIFTFRQQSTTSLPVTATMADLKRALEALPNIGEVTVDPMTDYDVDQLCTVAGNNLIITFLTEHGDLPPIGVASVGVTKTPSTTIETVAGTKEQVVCSGRGLCDHAVGKCVCFPGYGSSDGKGGSGQYGDCGYIEPVVSP